MTSQSLFDPQSYLSATINEPTTRRPPIPAGLILPGIITAVTARPWQGKKDSTKSGIAMDVAIEVDVSSVPQLSGSGFTSVKLTDGIMLDLTESDMIDNSAGKNGKMRRYREALNMNKPGEAFSFQAMVGRPIKVKVKHEEYEGELLDKVDSVVRA